MNGGGGRIGASGSADEGRAVYQARFAAFDPAQKPRAIDPHLCATAGI
jgi:hypothetical protein